MTPSRFTVMGLPTLLFLRNGAEIDRQVGIVPYEDAAGEGRTLLHEVMRA